MALSSTNAGFCPTMGSGFKIHHSLLKTIGGASQAYSPLLSILPRKLS
jgi:hypothetical protein